MGRAQICMLLGLQKQRRDQPRIIFSEVVKLFLVFEFLLGSGQNRVRNYLDCGISAMLPQDISPFPSADLNPVLSPESFSRQIATFRSHLIFEFNISKILFP